MLIRFAWRSAAASRPVHRLRARKAQLEFKLDQPPTAPTPGDLIKIGDHIRDVLTRGTPAARKALFESLIDDITVNSDDTVTPRFRVPMLGKMKGWTWKAQPYPKREPPMWFAHSDIRWTGGYGIRTPRPSRVALSYGFRWRVSVVLPEVPMYFGGELG